jgi:hypothetical protein
MQLICRLLPQIVARNKSQSTIKRGYAAAAVAAAEHAGPKEFKLNLSSPIKVCQYEWISTFSHKFKAIYPNVVVKQIDVPGMASNMVQIYCIIPSNSFVQPILQGLLPIHVPTIAMLKPGVLTVYELDGNMTKYFVSSGSVSMNMDGSCQILAEEIVSLDDLDAQVFAIWVISNYYYSFRPLSICRRKATVRQRIQRPAMWRRRRPKFRQMWPMLCSKLLAVVVDTKNDEVFEVRAENGEALSSDSTTY